MIEPKNWQRFKDDNEKLAFMKKHQLISKTARFPKRLVYSGPFLEKPELCELVGHDRDYSCILDIHGHFHAIAPDYLLEMQAGKSLASLPDEYIVLDFETTGFRASTDEIIEIAALKYHGNTVVDSYETLINPGISLPKSVQKITGITPMDLFAAPSLDDCVEDFFAFLGETPIFAHNAVFERSFLEQIYSRYNVDFKNDMLDSIKLAKKAYPGLPSYKLEDLKEALGLPVSQSHRAMADVENTAALIQKCSARLAGADVEEPRAFSAKEPEIVLPEEPVVEGSDPIPATELEAYDRLKDILLPALESDGLDASILSQKPLKDMSAVRFVSVNLLQDRANALDEDVGPTVFCRLRFRKSKHYVEVSSRFADEAKKYGETEMPKREATNGVENKDWCKLICQEPSDLEKFGPLFLSILAYRLDNLPTEFGCCSRYEACSNAKKCVNPNKQLALQCYYLKNLRNGKIFYGENAETNAVCSK